MPVQPSSSRPVSQFRFVETRMLTTSPPGLSQDVKYVAAYRMDDGRLVVLAQAGFFKVLKWINEL